MGKNRGRDHEHQVAINDEITKISTEILQKNIDAFAMRRWLTRELAIARIRLAQYEDEVRDPG